MRNIKVLYILNSTIMGGATISFINLIKGLASYGVQPVVILPQNEDKGDELICFFQQHHIAYYKRHVISSSLPKPVNLLQLLKVCVSFILMYYRRYISYLEILDVVKKEKPDIIHTNVGVIREGLYAAKKTKTPHIQHIREYQNKDFGWIIVPSKNHYEQFLQRSDAIITITDNLKSYFHLQGVSNAVTIYNGIYSISDTKYCKEKKHFFLCACRIVSGKGYEDIVEAFSRFKTKDKYRDYELIIAGQGEDNYLNIIKDAINSKPCKDCIKLLGHIKDVRPLMAEATALLVASKSEGFGRMTAEACFNGCLVIGRETGGTKEILQATGGFLFKDIDTFVTQMEKVCQLSSEDYQNLALEAQAKAKMLYSTESNCEKTYKLYKQLI